MRKRKVPDTVFLFYTKGMLIFFSIVLIATIIGFITNVYILSCLGIFILVYGNMTLFFGTVVDKREDYARRDGNNGSDMIGHYDGPKDQYLDRF